MREIKFRGKRVDNGEWVYGYFYSYVRNDNGKMEHCILQDISSIASDFKINYVDPSTVGQYTGLKDKNGKEIYEGDIILWGDKTAIKKGTAIHVVVEFKSGCFGVSCGERFHEFYHYCSNKWDDSEITDDMWGELPLEKYLRACFEAVGNIHDNPELPKE